MFFSYSSSKLPSYILPIFPALALLIAMHLDRKVYRGMLITGILMSVFGLTGLTAWVCSDSISALHKNPYEDVLYHGWLPWIGVASLLMFLSGVAACIMARYHQQRAVWILAWSGFVCGQLLLLGYEPWGSYRAGTEHLAAIQSELTPTMPLYAVGQYEQSLPFYLRHTTILVEHPDEMEFGLEHEPQLWIPKRSDFVRQWLEDQAQGIPAMAILRPDIYTEFLQQGIPMRLISQDPRRVIVSSNMKLEAEGKQ